MEMKQSIARAIQISSLKKPFLQKYVMPLQTEKEEINQRNKQKT